MKKEHLKEIEKIIQNLADFPYWEVLDILNGFSIQIFACAPNNTIQLAIKECHRVQSEAIEKYLNEKKNTKDIVDKAIVDFGHFAESESKPEDEKQTQSEEK
jgi:hypothetical protein